MEPSQSILQEDPGRGSQAHAPSLSAAQHMPLRDMYQASIADGGSDDGNGEDTDEAIYREDDRPLAKDQQGQNPAAWMQASMAQHEQAIGVVPSASLSQQTEHVWQSNLRAHQNNPHMSQSLPSQPASQGMNTFQPIVNMRLQSTSSQNPSPAFTASQQARQPANTAADRYQHATVLASPDDFVWQPIRPQTGQHPEQYASGHDSIAASMADASDSYEPAWMTQVVPPTQTGHYSRSLGESLDAAARLDSRLQSVQQEQQQQQQHGHWQLKPGQSEPAAKDTMGSSASWQDLQDPYAAGQPVATQHAALYRQQPISSAGTQAQQREAMPLIDRSKPQTAAEPLPGRQGQYDMPLEEPFSADWPTHAPESDAVREARLHGSRLSGTQGASQHDSWAAAEAGLAAVGHQGSTGRAQHESQLAGSSGNHAEAFAPARAAGSVTQRPYQVRLGAQSRHACMLTVASAVIRQRMQSPVLALLLLVVVLLLRHMQLLVNCMCDCKPQQRYQGIAVAIDKAEMIHRGHSGLWLYDFLGGYAQIVARRDSTS